MSISRSGIHTRMSAMWYEATVEDIKECTIEIVRTTERCRKYIWMQPMCLTTLPIQSYIRNRKYIWMQLMCFTTLPIQNCIRNRSRKESFRVETDFMKQSSVTLEQFSLEASILWFMKQFADACNLPVVEPSHTLHLQISVCVNNCLTNLFLSETLYTNPIQHVSQQKPCWSTQ